jgi:hypothetical protein
MGNRQEKTAEAMTTEDRKESREKVLAGLRLAVAEALEVHRKAGRMIVVWKDGRVVWLPVKEAIEAAAQSNR